MYVSEQRLRLSPEDDYMHPLESASNFNESMYFNLFDHEQKMGGWFRLGNRPNEGHAEMSCCLYLPDGRVGFMYQRPALQHNEAFDAAGMRFDVITAFKHLRLHYQGMLCVLDTPQDMENPRDAFSKHPILPCEVSLDFHSLAPPFGGEPVDEEGAPIVVDAATSFARGHYEQHLSGQGHIQVGDTHYTLKGFGLRDHSWGPRYWQNIHWYRWLPLVFNEDFAMLLSVIKLIDAEPVHWGVVMRRDAQGNIYNDPVSHIDLNSLYDDNQQASGQTALVTTEAGCSYQLKGQSLSKIPLRNRRKDADGNSLHTRITEAMTEYQCNGQTGYGMAEYLDQMIDEKPAGFPA